MSQEHFIENGGRIKRLGVDSLPEATEVDDLHRPVIIHNYHPQPSLSQRLCGSNWPYCKILGCFVLLIASTFLLLIFYFDVDLNLTEYFHWRGSNEVTQTNNTSNFNLTGHNNTQGSIVTPSAPAVTSRPTKFPTAFPTTKPPVVESLRPTYAPSFSPTNAPVEDCLTPDAICGCNLVVSELIDIIFLVDESGSVSASNYQLMTDAIKTFATNVNPPMNPTNGTRIGYIEFSDDANEILPLSESHDSNSFIEHIDSFVYNGGATDHRNAILKAHDMMLTDNSNVGIRPGAQLTVVMLTDGNPCVRCRRICCSDSFAMANGAKELRTFRDDFKFTFYFLPIIPANGDPRLTISLQNFDGAKGQQGNSSGLSDDEFITIDPQGFDQLEEFLSGDTFTFPLGPCVKPPTVSSGDRLLLANEAGLP